MSARRGVSSRLLTYSLLVGSTLLSCSLQPSIGIGARPEHIGRMAETRKRQRNLRKRKLEHDSEPHSAEEDDDSLRCERTALLLSAGM